MKIVPLVSLLNLSVYPTAQVFVWINLHYNVYCFRLESIFGFLWITIALVFFSLNLVSKSKFVLFKRFYRACKTISICYYYGVFSLSNTEYLKSVHLAFVNFLNGLFKEELVINLNSVREKSHSCLTQNP